MTQWPFHLPLMAITSAICFLPTLVGYSIYHLAITSATLLNNTGYTMCLVVVKHLPHTTWQ